MNNVNKFYDYQEIRNKYNDLFVTFTDKLKKDYKEWNDNIQSQIVFRERGLQICSYVRDLKGNK